MQMSPLSFELKEQRKYTVGDIFTIEGNSAVAEYVLLNMFCNLVHLNRYLDNICKNPDEEKFQKVKQSNKVFQVRFSLKKIQDLEILLV